MVKTKAQTMGEYNVKKVISGFGILISQSLHRRSTVNKGAKQPPTYKTLLEKMAISRDCEVYRK